MQLGIVAIHHLDLSALFWLFRCSTRVTPAKQQRYTASDTVGRSTSQMLLVGGIHNGIVCIYELCYVRQAYKSVACAELAAGLHATAKRGVHCTRSQAVLGGRWSHLHCQPTPVWDYVLCATLAVYDSPSGYYVDRLFKQLHFHVTLSLLQCQV
jgi:hypothetical protein